VIALGAVLFSSAFADCCVEPPSATNPPSRATKQTRPTPPRTEEGFPKVIAEPKPSGDSFLGWCLYDVIELPRGEGWRLEIRGKQEWGRFDSMGVVSLFASDTGPDGVYSEFDYPVVTPSRAIPLEIPRHLFLGRELYVSRVDYRWCHAYVADTPLPSFDDDERHQSGSSPND